MAIDASRIRKIGSGAVPNGASALTAIAAVAPAGGTGATAGAYDTAAHRNEMIVTVNNNRTRISEIETALQAFGIVL
tara:strand:+ start:1545 stop:1775 length:231 start_codon:yes stop_codon:yes gene_type:complete